MLQITCPVDTQPIVHKLLQPRNGDEDISGELGAENIGPAVATRTQLPEGASSSTKYGSVLSESYVDDVEELIAADGTQEALRSSQRKLRQVSRQLLTIQEKERQRIAADLHDGIGQSLSLIKLTLELAMRQFKAGEGEQAVELMQRLMLKIKETMNELHRTTMELHPPMLEDLGILPTLSWFFREFESAWNGGNVEKDIGVDECDVSGPLKATIFRILQEAMNNVVKHSRADKLHVCLKKNGCILQLSIEDNGCGFDLAGSSVRSDPDRGFGLFTMMERARSTGGSFDMKSTPESGTRILISWRITDDSDSGELLHASPLHVSEDR